MDEMKNLVIQSLETRGVLGQIRAKLRSTVFKVVDEQDQKSPNPTGCGLKWENSALYKIKDTNVGGLIAELMREFMEHLRMDYSLSVFIPECSISPERLKREELYARLGLNLTDVAQDLPLIYLITFYFLDSVHNNPQKVFSTLEKMKDDLEKSSDEYIMKNFYNAQENLNEEEELRRAEDLEEEIKQGQSAHAEEAKADSQQTKQNKATPDFEKISEEEIDQLTKQSQKKRSLVYEDRNNRHEFDFDDQVESNDKQEPPKEKSFGKAGSSPKKEKEFHSRNEINSSEQSIEESDNEIVEDIIMEESYERSNDKRGGSSNTYTISQSGNYDGTVDSKALERYNYIEPVEKDD